MKREVTGVAAANLSQLLENAGINVWLDAGWAVDAVLGQQTRPHKDLDIILSITDVPRLHDVLELEGFKRADGGTASNFVLQDETGREVDVHVVEFDREGNGVYRMENGSDWIFPADGFNGRGVVEGTPVRCLTPVVQVLCHAHGYVPTEKDFRDMELIEARFGVELPPHLRRQR